MEHRILRLKHPGTAAPVLVSILGGEAVPLPPFSKCWLVLTECGLGLELYHDVLNRQSADYLDPFAADGTFIALSSGLPACRIITLAQKAGWPVRQCGDRVEIAVEGRYRLDIRPGDSARVQATACVSVGDPKRLH